MMPTLGELPWIHQFLGRRLLKGFSTAVVPTEKLEDSILWHLYYTEDGSRLLYPDFKNISTVDVGLDEVIKGVISWDGVLRPAFMQVSSPEVVDHSSISYC